MSKYDARINRMKRHIPRKDFEFDKVSIVDPTKPVITEDGRILTHEEYCEEFDVVILSPNLTDEQKERNDRIFVKMMHGDDDW